MNQENVKKEEAPEPLIWEERGPDVSLIDLDKNWDKIECFFSAAARGVSCGSGGEKRAHQLAKLMSKAIEESAGTDMDVVEGAALLMCYAAKGGDYYCTMRSLLNKHGYRRAAR